MWEIVPNFSRHRSKFPLMAEHPRSKRVLLVTIQTLRGAFQDMEEIKTAPDWILIGFYFL